MQLDEPRESLGTLEEIHVDRFVGARQRQVVAQVCPLCGQLIEQPVMRGQGEIGVDHQLVADQRILARRRQLASKGTGTAAKNNHGK
jgi:hypothetical protein